MSRYGELKQTNCDVTEEILFFCNKKINQVEKCTEKCNEISDNFFCH